jgi:hypothetical protein
MKIREIILLRSIELLLLYTSSQSKFIIMVATGDKIASPTKKNNKLICP